AVCRLVLASGPVCVFFFSSRRRHTRSTRDWSSDVCSSDLERCLLFGLIVKAGPGYFQRPRRSQAVLLQIFKDELSISHGKKISRSEERRVGKECKLRWGRKQ